jgi:hypothetical protein
VKLALYLVLSTICFWALFGVLNLRLHRRQSEQTMLQDAERISEIIQRSTRHQMLRNDRPALAEVITDIGSQPGIRLVRVFNKEGRISYSSTASEVETMVDKRAEQCYACHARSAPLQKLNRPDRARIFTDPRAAASSASYARWRTSRIAGARHATRTRGRSESWGSSTRSFPWERWTSR